LTSTLVYVTWLGITSMGVIGYLLYRAGRERIGLPLLALYAALGFDGLLHYGRAPFAAHTSMMNFTIWTEVVAAAVLLATVVAISIAGSGRRLHARGP
jgi:hypothetical protein